jgi:hypothetical protein
MNESQKQQVYNEWQSLVKNNPGKAIQMSMEEAAIVNEMRKRENTMSRSASKQEQEAWLERKTQQLELEEAEKKKRPVNEIKKFDRLFRDGANY